MNSRERILAAGVLLLFGYVGVKWFVDRVIQGPLNQKELELTAIMDQVAEKQRDLQHANDAEYDIGVWQAKALPADLTVAQGQYYAFLTESLSLAGVERPSVNPATALPKQGQDFVLLPFTINMDCTLTELTQFLHEFYSSELLHQIQKLSIKPVLDRGKANEFNVIMLVEAMSMHDALAKDGLPGMELFPDEPRPLPPELTLFAKKNLFQPTAFKKPAPVTPVRTPPPPPKPDERGDYVVNAATKQADVGMVGLINVKTKRELALKEGDKLEINGLNATVVEVQPPKVLLEVDGNLALVRVGRDLKSLVIQGPMVAGRHDGDRSEE